MFIVLPTPYLGNIGTARVEALITLALHRKIERIATMATSIATVTNTATRIPSGFRFPLPAAPYREIKLVAKTTGASANFRRRVQSPISNRQFQHGPKLIENGEQPLKSARNCTDNKTNIKNAISIT